MPSRTQRRFVVLAILVGVILAVGLLGLIEIALRIHSSRIPEMTIPTGIETPAFMNRPDTIGGLAIFGFRYQFHINHLGLRGPETTLQKPKGTQRVLIVGDSVAFSGLADEDETWSMQLQKIMNIDTGHPLRWEVLNGAVGSYNIWDTVGLLKLKGLEFQPDIVIFGMYMNDHVPSSIFAARTSLESAARHSVYQTVRGWIFNLKIMQSLPLLLGNMSRAKHPFFKLNKTLSDADRMKIQSYYPGEDAASQAVIRFIQEYQYDPGPVLDAISYTQDASLWSKNIDAPLAEFKQICAERKIKLMVTLFPIQYEIYPGYQAREPRQTIQRIISKLNIPYIDFRDVFLAKGFTDELYPSRYDMAHPGPEAYRAAADATHAKLIELGWK